MKLRKGKSNTQLYDLQFGPYHGYRAYLPQETMVFSAKGFKRGRYVMGRWQNV